MIKFFNYSDYAAARDAGRITADQPVKLVGNDPQDWVQRYEDSRRFQWQPIETAPRDGSKFLMAYHDGSVVVGYFLDNTHTRWPWSGFRPMYGVEKAGNRIVHWMPLPPAPTTGDTHD